MEIEFVTLGAAAKMIDMPSPTLRGWSDRLEELGIHYLERNHRDERIFFKEDIEIFKYMKELKDEHGRMTTTTDIAYVIHDNKDLKCRSKSIVSDVPTRRTSITKTDMEYMLEQEDFQKFMEVIVDRSTKEISDKLSTEITENLSKDMSKRINEIEERRAGKFDSLIQEQRKTQKMMEEYLNLSLFQKLFTKNPFKK